MLRINHYKPGKQLKKEIRDASLTPIGPAIHAEILRAYNRPADDSEMAEPLQNSTHLTQTSMNSTQDGISSSSSSSSSKVGGNSSLNKGGNGKGSRSSNNKGSIKESGKNSNRRSNRMRKSGG